MLAFLLAVETRVDAGPDSLDFYNSGGQSGKPLGFLLLGSLLNWEVFCWLLSSLVYWFYVFDQQICVVHLWELGEGGWRYCGDSFGCELVCECLHYSFYYL